MALEEAAALGCLLPRGTTRDDVPARLAAYQAVRKDRGEYVNTESVAQVAVPEKRGEYLRCKCACTMFPLESYAVTASDGDASRDD
jgi:hypothetical protein